MNRLEKEKLRKIVVKNSKLFQMTIKDRKEYCMKEDLHLFTFIENELFSWELQIAIDCATEGRIHLMMFLHPVVITTKQSWHILSLQMRQIYIWHLQWGDFG